MGKRRPAVPLESDLSGTLHGSTPHAELDLHGMRAEQALRRVDAFLDTWERRQPGAILRIITGRGNRSPGDPVLRGAVREQLQAEVGARVSDMVLDAGAGGWLVRLGDTAR